MRMGPRYLSLEPPPAGCDPGEHPWACFTRHGAAGCFGCRCGTHGDASAHRGRAFLCRRVCMRNIPSRLPPLSCCCVRPTVAHSTSPHFTADSLKVYVGNIPPPSCDCACPTLPLFGLPHFTADSLKVYVGNIPPDTSVDEIRDTFKGFGRVRPLCIVSSPCCYASRLCWRAAIVVVLSLPLLQAILARSKATWKWPFLPSTDSASTTSHFISHTCAGHPDPAGARQGHGAAQGLRLHLVPAPPRRRPGQ